MTTFKNRKARQAKRFRNIAHSKREQAQEQTNIARYYQDSVSLNHRHRLSLVNDHMRKAVVLEDDAVYYERKALYAETESNLITNESASFSWLTEKIHCLTLVFNWKGEILPSGFSGC